MEPPRDAHFHTASVVKSQALAIRFAPKRRIARSAGVSGLFSIVDNSSRRYVQTMAEAIWANRLGEKTDFLSRLPSMDPKDIPERLSAIGRNQAQLARHIGLDPSSLTKTIKGVRRLKADEMIALEQFLAQDPVPGSQPWSRPQMVSRYSVAEGSKIAIFGYAAAAGEDSIAMNDGGIVEWIEAPPHHNGAELFGVRVLGVSMIPRFFEGEKAIAQRLLPPARGQDVVVEFEDGSGVIKTYVNQKDGFVNCEQWNEPRPLSYSLTGAKNTRKVKALHAVLWRR